MMASELDVVSRTEETSLILGTYIVGPMASGVTMCLLFCIFRFAIRNTKDKNIMQYLIGIFSMLFTILLNISYCVLGTDLLVPWNDNISVEGDYDSNTMLEFTSLCIFLWYFSKLLFYTSFIYYTYSFIKISSKLKLYLKSFMFIQIILTLVSISTLIYLNHNIYQIAITPEHNIQLITQLKGYYFYKNHTHSLTEITSLVPIFTDISCLMVLFKLYIEHSNQLQFEQNIERKEAKKFIDICVRSIMLLFCGSLPTWILFINIFMKSSIIWILLPYDMLINNICLFLMYNENIYLYKLFCLNCHKTLFNQCFFSNKEAPQNIVKINEKSISEHAHNIINQKMDGLQMCELHTDDDIEIDLNISVSEQASKPNHNINIPKDNSATNENSNRSLDNSFHLNDYVGLQKGKPYEKPSLYPQKANHVIDYMYNESINDSKSDQMVPITPTKFKEGNRNGNGNSLTSSGSNIIKQIVMGSDHNKRMKHLTVDVGNNKQHFNAISTEQSINVENFRKYDGFKNNGNPFINNKQTMSSETSIHTYESTTEEHKQGDMHMKMNTLDPFFCRGSGSTSISGIGGNSGMVVMENGNNKKNKRIQLRRSDTIPLELSEDNTTTTNTVSSRKKKIAHRRNTVDMGSQLSKDLKRKKGNNVSVPSFGHGHDVHFSFFE